MVAKLIEKALVESLVSWHSKKQNSVALSTAEAEYIAAGLGCAQVLWMKQTLSDFGLTYSHVPTKCDNTSAISISKNPLQHSRTKHILDIISLEIMHKKEILHLILLEPRINLRIFSQSP